MSRKLGAIQIDLYGPSDRRSFSVEESVAWLSNPMTGSAYQVELFGNPPPRSEWDRLDAGRRKLIEIFVEGFVALENGLSVDLLPNRRYKQPTLSVRLDLSQDQPVLQFNDVPLSERRREIAKFNPDIKRHSRLLAFLDNHPLVRRIGLPGIVVRSSSPATTTERQPPNNVTFAFRDSSRS